MSRRTRGSSSREDAFGVTFAPTNVSGLVAWWDGEGPFTLNDPSWADPDDMNTTNWIRTGITVTTGGVGPGPSFTPDAMTITNNSVSVRHTALQSIGVSDGYTAITVSAKAGTGRYLVIANTTAIWGVFDLQTGLVGASSNSGTRTMTDLGGGWYDCYMEMQSTLATFYLAISEADNFNSYVGTTRSIVVATPRIVRRNLQGWNPVSRRTSNYAGTQNTAANRPSLFASANHTRVKYDGTQQYMRMSTTPSDFTFLNGNAAAGCTTVTVINLPTLAAITTAAIVWDNSDDDHVVPPISSGSSLGVLTSGRILFRVSNGPLNIVDQQSTTAFAGDSKVCVVTRAGQSQTPNYSLRCNAVADSGTFSGASSGGAPLYDMFTGVRAGITGLWNGGTILSMMFYDRYLTDAEVLQLEQYCRNRFGVPA